MQKPYLIGMTDLTSHHNDGKLSTSVKLAEEYGISKATVERNAKLAEGINKKG